MHGIRSTAAQAVQARRLLELEGAVADDPATCVAAAARVHEKLTAQLSPLLGAGGVGALFVRSEKLARREIAGLAVLDVFAALRQPRAEPEASDPVAVAQTAEVVFGIFLGLIASFIGARLTTQALRSARPSIGEPVSTENET
jgi:hypothetical protein